MFIGEYMGKYFFIVIFSFMVFIYSNIVNAAETATIRNMVNYYKVDIDISAAGASRTDAGKAYGIKIKEAVTNYESLVDSYIAEMVKNQETYSLMLTRANTLWPNVPEIVQNEIDGIADSVCSTSEDVRGDGLLSKNELRLLNLIGDVMRETNCSAVGINANVSASGNVIGSRILDWDDGSTYQISRIQAVVTYKLPNNRSLTLIGYLGLSVAITGVTKNYDGNSDENAGNNLFFAILDSDIGGAFTCIAGMRSYCADLRKYVEDATSYSNMVTYLSTYAGTYKYTFGHLIYMIDKSNVGVYEDNLSATYGTSALRTPDNNNNLHQSWSVEGALGVVNCFMLPNSYNNSSAATEINRWKSEENLLSANGSTHSFDNLKTLSSYGIGDSKDGYLFRWLTHQIAIFEPATRKLEVAFHPVGRNWKSTEKPSFNGIVLNDETTVMTSSSYTVYVSADNGTLTANSSTIDVTLPSGYTDTYGKVAFTLSGLGTGETVRVNIVYPNEIPSGSKYFKYNSSSNQWAEYTNTLIAGRVVTLTLTDGGVGDADGAANGVIVDPGVLAVANSSSSSSSSGCELVLNGKVSSLLPLVLVILCLILWGKYLKKSKYENN